MANLSAEVKSLGRPLCEESDVKANRFSRSLGLTLKRHISFSLFVFVLLVFFFCYVSAVLKEDVWYKKNEINEKMLRQFWDLFCALTACACI